FEEAIRATAAPHAPWFIVPADNKWFTRLVVSAAIVEAVEKLDLTYPKIDAAKKKELAAARAALARESKAAAVLVGHVMGCCHRRSARGNPFSGARPHAVRAGPAVTRQLPLR